MTSTAPHRPDVVLVLLDQCSAKWLEIAESHNVCELPNLRALQAMGTTFTRCYSSNPLCCPARATLATGMTTRQHGLLQNGYSLDASLPTFMKALQGGGYHTAVAGKVHLHPHREGVYPDYRPYGFDESYNTEDPRLGNWLDWVRETHPEHYDAALMTVWTGQQPELDEPYDHTGKTLRQRLSELLEERGIRGRFEDVLPFPQEISQTNWITGHALGVRQRVQGKPLFVQVGYVQPHGPFTPPPGYLRRVNAENIPEPLPASWLEDDHRPWTYRQRGPKPTEGWRDLRSLFFADLCHLDDQLGRVMQAQRDAGRFEQTYFIFTADHGEMLLDHRLRGKGCWHYDACVRVPLTIAGPGVRAGQVREAFVQLEDLAPTIHEMAQAPKPELTCRHEPFRRAHGSIPAMHGSSLMPLLRGEPTPRGWRDSAYCESYNALGSADPREWSRTTIDHAWRYSVHGNQWGENGPQPGGEQLFNLAEDPNEQRNLAADADHRSILHGLRERLMHRIILQDAPGVLRGLHSLGVH